MSELDEYLQMEQLKMDSNYEQNFDEKFNMNKKAFEAQVLCISNVDCTPKEKQLTEFDQFLEEPEYQSSKINEELLRNDEQNRQPEQDFKFEAKQQQKTAIAKIESSYKIRETKTELTAQEKDDLQQSIMNLNYDLNHNSSLDIEFYN